MLNVIGGSVVGSPFAQYKSGPLIDDDFIESVTPAAVPSLLERYR